MKPLPPSSIAAPFDGYARLPDANMKATPAICSETPTPSNSRSGEIGRNHKARNGPHQIQKRHGFAVMLVNTLRGKNVGRRKIDVRNDI